MVTNAGATRCSHLWWACSFWTLVLALRIAAAGQQTYYEVLEIPKDADSKAIKSAYRKMALKWHPDKNPDNREAAEKKFREVAEAYEVLSDQERRKRYDEGQEPFQTTGGAGDGFDFSGFGGFGGFKDPKDLFKDVFGDADPFADFSKFFDDVQEEEIGETTGTAEAMLALERALAAFYNAVGQQQKATPEKARELLQMPKWAGKERSMFNSLRKKYSEPQYAAAVETLRAAFDAFDRSRNNQQRETSGTDSLNFEFGDFFKDFGGFGGGFNMDGAFGGGAFGHGFKGEGVSMSFSSFSSSSGGRTVKQETKIQGGRRVTKTVKSDATGTRATLEEQEGGRIRRQTGVKRNSDDQERLERGSGTDEM